MKWQALAAFIATADPAFAASLRGVAPEEIDRVERETGIRLPSAYRQFLQMMGRDSGGFRLFGQGQTHTFDELVADLPAESYPAASYFRIAFANDDAEISAPDHFLDLGRSDGDDAPIVMFEELPFFVPASVRERRFTFMEWATRQFFTYLVIGQAAVRSIFVLGFQDPADGVASRDEVIGVLGMMSFEPVLPILPRVACLRRAGDGALVELLKDGGGISVTLCGADRLGLDVAVDQLLMRFPAAVVSDPDSPSSW